MLSSSNSGAWQFATPILIFLIRSEPYSMTFHLFEALSKVVYALHVSRIQCTRFAREALMTKAKKKWE